jgi:hypothetical protein
MLMAGATWAIRQYLRSAAEQELIQAQTRMIGAISEAIGRGDTKTVKANEKIAPAILSGAKVALSEQGGMVIKPLPGVGFSFGNISPRNSAQSTGAAKELQTSPVYSNASKDSGFWDLIVNEPNIVSSQAIFRSTSGQKTGVLLLDHCSDGANSAVASPTE